MSARVRHTLHVVVLLLCCVAGSLAAAEHRCIFEELQRSIGPQRTAVVLELPTQERGMMQALTASGSGWASIRFKVFTEDMDDPSRYCTAGGESRPDFHWGTRVCEEEDIFTAEKKSIILNSIIPRAIKMHADRLLVEPFTGIVRVPESMQNLCAEFTIPESHHTVGVSDADMFLYAAAGPTDSGTAAWADSCYTLLNGRPILGAMNFGSRSIADSEFSVRVLAHEISHALGFRFETFRDRNMLRTEYNVRGKSEVLLVSSPKTLEKTREHFNCMSATGMELEDEGGDRTRLSHWKRRNAKDDLMTGLSEFGRYTALTMAALEDTGFYRAKWGMEEPMSRGNNSGCALLTEKCLTNGVTHFPEMFCNSKSELLLCTLERMALGQCSIEVLNEPFPPQYQYFADPKLGAPSNRFMDHCPSLEAYVNTRCIDGDDVIVELGGRVGPASRCLKGDGLRYSDRDVGDVCAEVSCDGGTVSVRYLGDDTWYECPEGSTITPTGLFTAGKIECPRRIDVCYELKWEDDDDTHSQ